MTAPNRDDRVDRYLRGELTPAEARELAQESLENPELFEELTYAAVAKKTVAAGFQGGKVMRFWRPGRLIIAGSIAAAILVASIFTLRLRTPAVIAPSTLLATLDPARGAQQPVLLAAGLQANPLEQPEIFRGAEPESRSPKLSGGIVAVDGRVAVIDLGSVDGLTGGTELDVYRDGAAIGHLRVAAVFRERARASIDGRAQEHDEVRIAPTVHLMARMERVHALAARGDLAAARTAAEDAVRWAGSAGVPAEAQAAAWNTLAVLRILQSDRAGGEMLLRQALAECPSTDPSYPMILNNLGVLAELSGDRAKAREQYGSALRALSGRPGEAQEQEKGVESNLARIAR
jgi:hypothetical protein